MTQPVCTAPWEAKLSPPGECELCAQPALGSGALMAAGRGWPGARPPRHRPFRLWSRCSVSGSLALMQEAPGIVPSTTQLSVINQSSSLLWN